MLLTLSFVLVAVAALIFGAVLGYCGRAMNHIDFMADIVDFHTKFGLEYRGPPRVLPPDLSDFRIKFEEEELFEYKDVETDLRDYLDSRSVPEVRKVGRIDQLLELQLDALVDLTYVVLGHAYLQFGPRVFAEAWERVHYANMKKVRKIRAGSGHVDSGRAPMYDVVKPAGWEAPNHLDLIQRRHATVQ